MRHMTKKKCGTAPSEALGFGISWNGPIGGLVMVSWEFCGCFARCPPSRKFGDNVLMSFRRP